ncbi:MAG: YceI family protein [Bacteroidia bacterium]|nr:YceI family protein [Bacteroidia bacterium]
MKTFTTLLTLACLVIGVQAQTSWKLDKSHTGIKFTTTHMLISEVEGQFNDFDGSVVSTTPDFNGAKIEFVAKVSSIDTGNERRDGHLKGPDFFDAENHPEVKFNGKLVKKGKKYFLEGDFTMRGTTKPIKFDVVYNGTVAGGRGKKAGFKITGVVNRFDYGLQWNRAVETGGLVVADEVAITCNVELDEVVAQ